MTTSNINRRTALAGGAETPPRISLLEHVAFASDDELIDLAATCEASIDQLFEIRRSAKANAANGRAV